MERRVIAFGHKKRTGKDTAANEIALEVKRSNPQLRVKKVAFADPLYEVCHTLYGWAGFRTKEEYDEELSDKSVVLEQIGQTPRDLLIKTGMAIRGVYEPTWVKYALNQADADITIISDMRFPNEFQAVKDFGGLCIKIERPDIEITDDVADCALDDEIRWDACIVNDGSMNKLCYAVYKEVKDYLSLSGKYHI
jgi:hypothetical protein